ncbi:unnamed protein product [Sphagnum jensenii]|uniref:Uncharacterized protein n=2 Tax=Sphagnum jensenii TaxID=128206 RepID=A0ABP0W5P1_9BRYO
MAPRLFSVIGTVCFMLLALLDATQLQGVTAMRLLLPGNHDAPVIIDTGDLKPDFMLDIFTDCQQDESGCSHNHENSGRFEGAIPAARPHISNVETTKVGGENSSNNLLHGRPFKFHAQRADKGAPVPPPPNGNPGQH